MKLRAPVWAAFAVALAFTFGGCANYQLGTRGELAFQTLYVAPVTNQALVPQAVGPVTREIRSAFLRDGRVQLVESADAADATLTIELVDYWRQMTASRPEDTGRARKFDLTLTAVCTLTDRRTGQVLLERRPIGATRQIFTDNGQLPAEYQALPHLAQQFADRVVHGVLDLW